MRGSAGTRAGRRIALVGVALALAVTCDACATDPTDFQRSAEGYIESDAMAAQSGTRFTEARCDRPTAVAPGTAYSCTATDPDGTHWAFDVVIVDDTNFEITGRPN